MTRPHRPILAAALFVLALFVGACASSEAPSETAARTPTSEPSATASASASPTGEDDADDEGEETSAFDLTAGDCFSASGDEVETVTVVDCAEPHVYEAFAVFDHDADADAPYPGDAALLEYADAACQPLFEDYVGVDYGSSAYWITSVTPSQETWDEGDDREIVCALKLGEDGEETAGSAEGSGR